jgi:hypothetical protein
MELSTGHREQHPEVPPADRAEIADALYRYATGMDLHDRALFESAFSNDAMLDFTSPARGLETTVPILEGRQSIGDAVMASTAPLVSSHSVFNLRVTAYDGGHATSTALVEEHYFQKGGSTGHLVLMNVYAVDLWRESRRWLITRLTIENLWFSGDIAVLWLPSLLATRAAGPISLSDRRRKAGLRVR